MKKLITALCVTLFGHWTFAANTPTQWKKIKVRKKVHTFSGEIKNRPLVAFKGEAKIHAPLAKVVSVIYDFKNIKKWMSDLKESKILETKNELERIEYNETNTPWPLWNRDFVYSVKVAPSNDKKKIKIHISPTSHPKAPKKKEVIRGEIEQGLYVLEETSDPNITKVTVTIIANPKGDVPKWVVNIFQSVWPSETIAGIREIAEDKDFKAHPKVVQFLNIKQRL